jgi:hypothetical protein
MPKIAAASEYAEQLAREIKGEAVSREIYEKLRKESPDSTEAKRLAAYWSFPALAKAKPEDEDYYDVAAARRDANLLGYPCDDFRAFEKNSESESRADWDDIAKRAGHVGQKEYYGYWRRHLRELCGRFGAVCLRAESQLGDGEDLRRHSV